MADGLNRVMLLGNLGADPELKMTANGQAVMKMRLATTESYLDKNKTRQERTEWHSVTLWGKRAEGLAKFLSKGDRLFIEGGIRTSSYEDKNGEKRYRTEVVATNVILSGGGGAKRDTGPRDAPDPEPDPDDVPGMTRHRFDDAPAAPGAGDDDDIPFAPVDDTP